MTAKLILQPTISAYSSSEFSPRSDTISMQVVGLSGTETATIEFKDPITGSFVPYLGVDKFSVTCNLQDVFLSYATYRVTKTITVSPVGVVIIGEYV